MKKYIRLVIILLILLTTGCSKGIEVTYLGFTEEDLTRDEVFLNNNKIFKFDIDGEIVNLEISDDEDYSMMNKLVENEKYIIEMEEDKIIKLDFKDDKEIYSPLIMGNAGEKTVKNLLKTAMGPLGTTLYVYGGGWNIQDDGSSDWSRTIGVPQYWVDFFNKMDENYDYLKYYPDYEWNKYHYLGMDCSGYMGWIVYNIMNTSSMNEGYVTSSTKMAYNLANTYNYGVFKKYDKGNMTDNEYYLSVIDNLKPGDIISIKGHTYMVLGVCSDKSVIIINSTVTKSVTDVAGGGVQLNVLALNNSKDNEAYKLINYYMKKYYNDWYLRYPVVVKDIDTYFNLEGETTGVFSFNILEDNEGYLKMNANDILKDIFNE